MGAELEQREVETRLEHLVASGGEVSLYCLYILIPEQMGRNVTFVYGIRMIHRGGEFRGAKRRFRSAMGLRFPRVGITLRLPLISPLNCSL